MDRAAPRGPPVLSDGVSVTPHLTRSCTSGGFASNRLQPPLSRLVPAVVQQTSLCGASAQRRMRGIWFAGFDHVRVGNGRQRNVAGIFERRRRGFGRWNIGSRNGRDIARRNPRPGGGRFGNLLRMMGIELFQNEDPFLMHRSRWPSRSRVMNPKRVLAQMTGSLDV